MSHFEPANSEAAALNSCRNAALLLRLLSEVPPEHFEKIVRGLLVAVERIIVESEQTRAANVSPGVGTAFQMLTDETLWKALIPLSEGAKAFVEVMARPVEANATGVDTPGS
ncbi:hypothetical protein BURKHO8Y_100007 [Burkholderia sp. 8Y]|uniref:hypothetical protein n=1 Tax=Burkholderia sp. 8Y TaxID=2653133 RepID=UPI0012F25EFA|nr:hypothetical protein [Burkholderia sp. 8Y]VXB12816.1 hypothetical protein BURKHO8Y_100007 [Burkholderia sp. 8Y]